MTTAGSPDPNHSHRSHVESSPPNNNEASDDKSSVKADIQDDTTDAAKESSYEFGDTPKAMSPNASSRITTHRSHDRDSRRDYDDAPIPSSRTHRDNPEPEKNSCHCQKKTEATAIRARQLNEQLREKMAEKYATAKKQQKNQ